MGKFIIKESILPSFNFHIFHILKFLTFKNFPLIFLKFFFLIIIIRKNAHKNYLGRSRNKSLSFGEEEEK